MLIFLLTKGYINYNKYYKMIRPDQIKFDQSIKGLAITVEGGIVLIAQISPDRTITYNRDLIESLSEETLKKIENIAKYYDEFLIDTWDRVMLERPKIEEKDIIELYGENVAVEIIEITYDKINQKNLYWFIYDNKKQFDLIENIILKNKFSIEPETELYYIQDGYIGNSMSWWRLDSKGHTTDINLAHKYTEKEALNLIADKGKNRQAWLVSYIDSNENAKKVIIDRQYLEDKFELKKENEKI